MDALRFSFDAAKAAEIVLFLAAQVPNPTFMKLAKLIYFADKTSLETYGMLLSQDAYVAMQHGPVPSSIYDMLKAARDTDRYGFTVEESYLVVPQRPANRAKLSDADVACLQQVVTHYGDLPAWHLRQLSHDDAWEHAWSEALAQGKGSVTLSVEAILSALDEGEDILDYLRETTPNID